MKNNFKRKNVLVYGMSVSGVWCAKLLKKVKANIFLFDDNLEKLNSLGLKRCTIIQKYNEEIIKGMDYVIVSPSIEKDNPIIVQANNYCIPVLSELEFASQFCGEILAVTGTNGKTTTVSLISEIINTQKHAIACGNIGYPLSKAVLMNKKSIKVTEVSSFMLENAKTFSPHVATVLNIEPDHLIRHKTMQEYEHLKMNIFSNLKTTDYAVVNLDEKVKVEKACNIVTYSFTHNADVRVKDGSIYLHQSKILDLNELKLKGKHNIYNVMCAICYGYILNIKPDNIRKALINFKSDKFRNEHIATINGIHFVNDSKSTNIASTLASVNSIKGAIVLLLGGSKKQLDYTNLFKNLTKRVKQIVAFGEIASDIKSCAPEDVKIDVCEDLSQGFDLAVTFAKKNDTILLSPSSASYDQFSNYVERGLKFNEKVKDYEHNQANK